MTRSLQCFAIPGCDVTILLIHVSNMGDIPLNKYYFFKHPETIKPTQIVYNKEVKIFVKNELT